MQNNMVRI